MEFYILNVVARTGSHTSTPKKWYKCYNDFTESW